jgi:flavorubredoxin
VKAASPIGKIRKLASEELMEEIDRTEKGEKKEGNETYMKAIVLFDTLYGNTEKIANSLAKGLQEAGVETEYVNIKGIDVGRLSSYDLLVIGAPTQYISASKPTKNFLERLNTVNLKGKYGFAFDTKLDYPLSGSGAKFIEKKLKGLGLEIIRPRSSAIVVVGQKKKDHDKKIEDVMLKEGMDKLFEKVGKELGVLLKERAKKREGVTA